MIRSAIAAMMAAMPAAAQTQGQPQTPAPNYPYQEVERPPASEVIRDVVQDAVDAAAGRAREERRRERRERERLERERLEWERQQAQIPPTYPEPPVAVVPPQPERSSPSEPDLNPEPVAAPAQPIPTRPAVQKPTPAVAQAASPAKAPPAETAPPPEAARPPVDTNPTVTAIGDPPLTQPETKTCPDGSVVAASAACPPQPSPLSRWWSPALLGLGMAAAAGGWSIQQRRARIARTKALLSLEPRLDQQAGTSSTTPIKLAAPQVSIRTRLEYS